MGELVNQLRKHIEEVGDAAFEQELFEFNCKYYGIDPNHPHARRKLKWHVFMEKVKDTYVPMVVDFFCILCPSIPPQNGLLPHNLQPPHPKSNGHYHLRLGVALRVDTPR